MRQRCGELPVRVGTATGRYLIRNLPAGEYFMIAYDDILVNEWFDTTLLEQLAPRAARIRIGGTTRRRWV